MEKIHVKTIFVCVVYRNLADLDGLIQTLNENVGDYKLILSNNHYSDEVDIKVEEYANMHNCDFISGPNTGYGDGNNRGIRYAKEHYDFEYLVICNSDLNIKSYDDSIFQNEKPAIYGPIIKTKIGKRQNPFIAHKNRFAEFLLYRGFKKSHKYTLYLGFAINKLIRLLYIFNTTILPIKKRRCFSVHGAFLIFNEKALEKLNYLPYDKSMFLFYEELYLGTKCKKLHIKFYYCKTTKIDHFEDGTMNVAKINEKSEETKSYVTYYEKLR